jgi:hypothetical protein
VSGEEAMSGELLRGTQIGRIGTDFIADFDYAGKTMF